jgi:hypothetical protein
MTGDRVLSEVKSPTTPDVTRGVVDAMGRLVAAAPRDADRGRHERHPHFTNAVAERKRRGATVD